MDQAAELRAYIAQNPEVKQMPTEPDYRALWLGFKAQLRAEASAYFEANLGKPSYDQVPGAHTSHFADRMEEAESSSRLPS